MTKIIEIKNCNDCKHYLPFKLCQHPIFMRGKKDYEGRELPDMFGTIPSWCPLPDKKEGK